MRHTPIRAPQFYVTAPQGCPYLSGPKERKLFTALLGEDAQALNDALSRQGFRRSQNVLYRPSCPKCSACLSSRIPAARFSLSRNQRRVLGRNRNIKRRFGAAWATEEQFDLFSRYLEARHASGGMVGMDEVEFAAMVEESPVQTRVIEYWEEINGKEKLVAASLTDFLSDGVSMVYSFFDPEMSERSLGQYMILDHVEIVKTNGLESVYLGYWVPGSSKMDYKARFRPLEVYCQGDWIELDDETEASIRQGTAEPEPIQSQVAAIRLPKLIST